MTYRVEFTQTAENEAYEAYRYIALDSHANAVRWYERLHRAISTLNRYPRRCPIAPESRVFDDTIRQLIVAKYRILFTIRDRTVLVLHIRHGARKPIKPDEIKRP